MALTQSLIVDQIEVTASNVVQVRMLNQITDDSTTPPTVIAGTFQRHTIAPGQAYTAEDPKVQSICAAVHTPAVIAAYQAMIAAQTPQPIQAPQAA
jgi:hypothetical protein